MTYEEAKRYLIMPTSTSNHPSEEYLKQKQAYFMAIEALNYRISMEATNDLLSSNYAIPYHWLIDNGPDDRPFHDWNGILKHEMREG